MSILYFYRPGFSNQDTEWDDGHGPKLLLNLSLFYSRAGFLPKPSPVLIVWQLLGRSELPDTSNRNWISFHCSACVTIKPLAWQLTIKLINFQGFLAAPRLRRLPTKTGCS